MFSKLLHSWIVPAVLLMAAGSISCNSDNDSSFQPQGDEDLAVEVEVEEDAGPRFPVIAGFTREAEGDPLTEEEITAFTKKITGMWKDTGYFNWVWWTSHGYDNTDDPDKPGYKLWWQDTQSSKEGDIITFSHTGGADNLTLRTSKVLNNVIAGYLLSGDEMFRRIVIQYCKGIVALAQGMEFGENDELKYTQARAIFTLNHEYEMEGGRKVVVDYDPVKHLVESWNAHTIPNDSNPYWGPIWLRTMRSKDDVPHMYRTAPMLMFLIEQSEDPEVTEAAEKALEYLKGFAKDIVDQGYYIRTKDQDGNAFIPENDDGTIKDLADFNGFDILFPKSECNQKLSSALLAYGETKDNECGKGGRNDYEAAATIQHYFNYAIVRYFHMAATSLAILDGYDDVAAELLKGLEERAQFWMNDVEDRAEHDEWDSDVAAQLLAAASAGLPLTSREARHVIEQYTITANLYGAWGYWDPWDDSVPDGAFNYKPDRRGLIDPNDAESQVTAVRPTEIAYLLEYCFSPLVNPNGAKFVDCDIVADPSRWGE